MNKIIHGRAISFSFIVPSSIKECLGTSSNKKNNVFFFKLELPLHEYMLSLFHYEIVNGILPKRQKYSIKKSNAFLSTRFD